MTPLQLIQYYANLLILQYLQKPKAYATAQTVATPAIFPQTTVQVISFSGIAASGTFVLNYGAQATTAISWNAAASAIQTALQLLTGLSAVTVAGSIATTLTVTFTGVPPVAPLLTITANSLATAGAVAVLPTVTQTDITLPLTIQNAFNLTVGSVTAVGKQLDTLGKYAGVTRSGTVSSGPITLSDADFLSLVQFAILRNRAGSALADIQNLLQLFFANEVYVFDYQNMQMSYLINSTVGSQNLIKLLISQGLLLRPMGVSLSSVIYAPIINRFFGMRTYFAIGVNNEPFNNYGTYNQTWPWLTYANAISI